MGSWRRRCRNLKLQSAKSSLTSHCLRKKCFKLVQPSLANYLILGKKKLNKYPTCHSGCLLFSYLLPPWPLKIGGNLKNAPMTWLPKYEFSLTTTKLQCKPKIIQILQVKVIFFNLFLSSLFEIISAFFVVFLFSLNTVKAFLCINISTDWSNPKRVLRLI